MRRLFPFLLIAVGVVVAVPILSSLSPRPAASAAALRAGAAQRPSYAVGIGDQYASMFTNPLYQDLHPRYSRLVVPWNSLSDEGLRNRVDAWVKASLAAGTRPLLAFSRSEAAPRKLLSVKQYERVFKQFRDRYPRVRDFNPWNEINHKSQPTQHNPKRAAQYYNVVRRDCPGCTVVAADLLDQGGEERYLQAFLKTARGTPRIWGLHNYSDVNRKKRSGRATDRFLRTVRGQVWLTETGGIVRFPPAFPFNVARAAVRTRALFGLADRYSKRRAGYRSRITRVYLYQWTGSKKNAVRFDAGLTNRDGSARPAYGVVKRRLNRLR